MNNVELEYIGDKGLKSTANSSMQYILIVHTPTPPRLGQDIIGYCLHMFKNDELWIGEINGDIMACSKG